MRRSVLVCVSFMTVALSGVAPAQAALPAMCGRWKGDADIVVNWTKARTLPVEIVIASDDRVTGKIGDATILNGRFRSNRGWLGRALRIKTDWMIDGRLDGPIIAAENIVREELMMPLDWKGSSFEGGIATSGSKIGDRETMTLTARVILRRAPDMVVCQE
jgi:hypothetical protein